MNPFSVSVEEPFMVGESDLREFLDCPYKMKNGLILFCHGGVAELSIELKKYVVQVNTEVVILPETIVTLDSASDDFKVSFISFSKELFGEAVFRLDPPFFRFMKEHPCYTHTGKGVENLKGLIYSVTQIYKDRENMYRDMIVRNQLQCFFLDLYDKTRHAFTNLHRNGYNRIEEIIHKFIHSVHAHYLEQKDVAFYAGELCISPRYLSSATRQVTGDSAKTIIDRHIVLETKVLLRSTELTIQEISNRLNFPNQSYLGRYFKRHTGQSPMDYRNRRKGRSRTL